MSRSTLLEELLEPMKIKTITKNKRSGIRRHAAGTRMAVVCTMYYYILQTSSDRVDGGKRAQNPRVERDCKRIWVVEILVPCVIPYIGVNIGISQGNDPSGKIAYATGRKVFGAGPAQQID
ncbi:hypothetical protein V5O48_004137 [Marasmius crinis-equi]|uniref:Uncharacterized protein n=1 Tax=Marasmius crinis-equi TaxID=585013 RepID=A0ABR3FQV9_9AGAR